MTPRKIIFQQVYKNYGPKQVLSNLNLTFFDGRAYSLCAPSGTGKTTVLRLLLGLEKPDFGSVQKDPGFSRASVVFQEDRLLEDCNALQNIRFVTGNRFTDPELGLQLSALLPEDSLTCPVRQFSGGMKRRLAILRALLVPADFYVMDEPFAGLDNACKTDALRLIQKATQNKLLILAGHEPPDGSLLQTQTIFLPKEDPKTSSRFFHEIP